MQEADLAEESLKVLSLIASKFVGSDGPLDAFLRPVIKECNEHLEDAPTKQSQAAGQILHAIAKAAPKVADKIAKSIVPQILSLFRGSESITKRRGLLEVFNEITKAYAYLQGRQVDLSLVELQAVSNDALEAMLRALSSAPKAEVSFRLTSLDGLTELARVYNCLPEKDIGRIVEAVTDIVLHESNEGHGDIRPQAIKALTDLAHCYPNVVRDRSVPAFMVELPDMVTQNTSYAQVLETFVQLSMERQMFDTIVLRLKNKLQAAESQRASSEYRRDLLMALLYAFTLGSPMLQEDGTLRSEYYTDYAAPHVAKLKDSQVGDVTLEELEIVGRICNVTLRPQRSHFQSSVYQNNLEWLGLGSEPSSDIIARVSYLTPFLLHYHAAIRPEVADAEDVVATLRIQSGLAFSTTEPHAQLSLRHVALIVNKFLNPKTMQATLQACDLEPISLLSKNKSSKAFHVVITIVKALLIQGKSASLTTKYLETLLGLLSGADKSTARLFATLLAPDDILTKENHCPVSGLYKQKVFNQAIPHLVEAVRTADAAKKPNYLIAISGILPWLPYSIIKPALPSLILPLLQILDLSDVDDQEVKASALTVFESVLMHDPSLVSEHTASLVTRLLNSSAGPINSPSVRSKALQCLALVPQQSKRESAIPYRRQVVKRLLACLDDPKRTVRAEAVRCRTAWLGLDDGQGDEE